MEIKINNETFFWLVVPICVLVIVSPFILVSERMMAEGYLIALMFVVIILTGLLKMLNRHIKTTVTADECVMNIRRIALSKKVRTDDIIGLDYKAYWREPWDEHNSSKYAREKRARLIITLRDGDGERKLFLNDLAGGRKRPVFSRYQMAEPIRDEDVPLYRLYRYLSEVTGIE